MKNDRQSLLQILKKVVKIRIEIFQDSPRYLVKGDNDVKYIQYFLTEIQNKDQDSQSFYCYLIINITKVMELDSVNLNGQKRFLGDNFYCIHSICKFGTSGLFQDSNLIINDFNDKEIINQVKERLKNNISLIQIIVMQKVEFTDIDKYFDEISIKIFKHSNEFIKCVSSFDGQYLYVYDNDQLMKTLELAAVNNFYFWLIKNQNPFLILTEINKDILLDYLPVDAAGFYSCHVYKQRFSIYDLVRQWAKFYYF